MGFEKGKSGNPNGRPKKGQTLTDALRDVVDREELARTIWGLAIGVDDKGPDLAAIKYIYDRVDGRPVESVQHGNIDDREFIVRFLRPTETNDG